jgi:hypothetical protein
MGKNILYQELTSQLKKFVRKLPTAANNFYLATTFRTVKTSCMGTSDLKTPHWIDNIQETSRNNKTQAVATPNKISY